MDNENNDQTETKITPRLIEDEMKKSYLSYAMSVIVGRALPDVRDGLKPVHRRILYSMHELGLNHNKPFKKCARIVGDCLGKFHPHGDTAVYETLVRMAQNFSLRYPLIKGQGNFGCFTGDTKVELTDGRKLSFKKLIEEHKQGKKNYAYTVDENSLIKIAEIKNPRLTKENANIIKVILDNGEEIKCTPNHKFMLRNGTYKEAKNLTQEDSLMPAYFRLSTEKDDQNISGYKMILQLTEKDWNYVHVLADEWNIKKKVYVKARGRIRHHKDFNKLNNDPNNIQRMNWKEHWQTHYELISLKHKTSLEYRQALAEGRKKFWSKKENREKASKRISEQNKENWTDSKYRARMIKKLKEINIEFIKNNPEKRKEFSERLKKLWKQKNYKKLMSELKSKEMKKRWKNKDPSLRRFTSEESKKIWENKTHRKKRSEFTKKQWQKQEYKHKVITTKVLKQVNKLTKKHKKITPEIYDKEWINGLPKSKTALKYFNNFSDMIEQAKIYNHKIIRTEILEEKENVYDLTIDQTHNFALAAGVFVHNSIDGDPAAAQRYTEAKLNKIAEEMIGDIEKETVDFTPNFDGSLQEPLVLPSKIPNLLINGSTGIAVGMATNIPPHNLTEVCKATIKLIENPELSFEELIQELPGPDFPTGGIICGRNGILQAYKTGKGKVVIRAKHHFEETKNKKKIIITEIPYMVNKAQLLEQIADGVRDKTIEGITNLNDESDREGMRIVIDLKSGANEEVVLNQLYSHTRLQDTFGIIMLALDNYKPKVMPVKDVISKFITHRQNIVTRRTKYELKKAEEKAHILEGLIIALNNIDKVISLIKSTKKTEDAKNELMTVYSLTEIQAKSILEMRLQRLTGLEQEKINTEHTELLKIISELKELLSTEHNILNVVKKELKEIQEKYGDTRRSTISNEEITEIDLENLIEPEETVISLSNTGYVKRLSIDNYKQQKRGGKGVVGAGTKEEDFIQEIFVANTHDYLLVFTNQGKVHWLKVYEIPESGRYAKGSSIVNLLKLQKDETVMTAIPIKEFNKDNYLLMSTKKGLIKKTSLEDFSKPRKGGIIALTLEENDELIRVLLTDGTKQILIATEFGQAIRFNENDIRNSGRTSKGVRGIRLRKEDNVVDCQVAEDDKIFLSITEKGYGKRTEVKEYRLINRGGKGVRNIKITPKNGKVVAAKVVKGDEDVMIMTEKGVMIRIPVKGISVVGRNSQGVRVMKLANEDKVTGAALIVE